MSLLNKHFVEVHCDLGCSCDCSGSCTAETEKRAEQLAASLGWTKRGWKHCCPGCVRRGAIRKQAVSL